MADSKKEAIDAAAKLLDKKYGAKTIIKMDGIEKMTVEAIPTGSFSLDYVFGCGGLPRGRMVEVYGLESCGKTTLALFISAQVQKRGGKVVWIDAEHSFDVDYAQKLGLNLKDLYVSQPETGEEALDIIDKMASTSAIDLIVLDSVAALVPKRELEGELQDNEMAQTARMMSKAMRMLAGKISNTNTAVIFINQVREKVGIYWGKKETTTGGKALKYYASARLEVRKGKVLKRGSDIIGNEMIFCAVKNKVGLPFRVGKLDIIFGVGVDAAGEVLDFARNHKIIETKGRAFLYRGAPIGETREDAIKTLETNNKLYNEIYSSLVEATANGGLKLEDGEDADKE